LERSRRVDDQCRETGQHEREHQHAAANHGTSKELYLICGAYSESLPLCPWCPLC
jgi:hypothetical protein